MRNFKKILLAIAIIAVVLSPIFAAQVMNVTWQWSLDDKDVTAYRYQLNGESDEGWTVVGGDVSQYNATSLDPYTDYTLYLQASYDGSLWSESAASTAKAMLSHPVALEDTLDVLGNKVTIRVYDSSVEITYPSSAVAPEDAKAFLEYVNGKYSDYLSGSSYEISEGETVLTLPVAMSEDDKPAVIAIFKAEVNSYLSSLTTPVAEEPKAAEPVPAVVEEPAPVAEEPKAVEPAPAVVEEPAPVAEEPKAVEPAPAVVEEPAPVAEEPKAVEPAPAVVEEPAPVAEEPKAVEPAPAVVEEPAPVAEEPKAVEPAPVEAKPVSNVAAVPEAKSIAKPKYSSFRFSMIPTLGAEYRFDNLSSFEKDNIYPRAALAFDFANIIPMGNHFGLGLRSDISVGLIPREGYSVFDSFKSIFKPDYWMEDTTADLKLTATVSTSSFNFYLGGGVGYSIINPKVESTYAEKYGHSLGTLTSYFSTAWGPTGVIGMRFYMGKVFSLGLEGSYRYLLPAEKHYASASLAFGFTF